MTPQEWSDCTDPGVMLETLRPTATTRKIRLLAVACCRRVWQQLGDPECRRAVALTERVADDPSLRPELFHARARVFEAQQRSDYLWENPRVLASFNAAIRTAEPDFDFDLVTVVAADVQILAVRPGIDRELVSLIRDIFRHPADSIPFDPRWRTRNVIDLARTIYDDRLYERFPILADALMDAGCEAEELLHHCRHPVEHVRGCWLLDLILRSE
jgi:hypothetical protein